jgi:prepilin-type N-terminal cleavage/methylation domain-containing protein
MTGRIMKRVNFTFIELLVVIAVVAILASLLLPSLNRARAAGKQITCISNLRQIYQGCAMYVADYDGWMPVMVNKGEYTLHINPYLLQPGGTEAGTYPKRRLVFPRTGNVYFCPALTRISSSPVWPSATLEGSQNVSNYCAATAYMVNDRGSGGWVYQPTSGGQPIPYRRLEYIKDGSAILGEANYSEMYYDINYPNLWGIGVSFTKEISNINAPAWNHLRSTDFLFKDGHAANLKFTGGLLFDANFCQK